MPKSKPSDVELVAMAMQAEWFRTIGPNSLQVCIDEAIKARGEGFKRDAAAFLRALRGAK